MPTISLKISVTMPATPPNISENEPERSTLLIKSLTWFIFSSIKSFIFVKISITTLYTSVKSVDTISPMAVKTAINKAVSTSNVVFIKS